ncbi:hypothetical protein DK389_26305 [Methylobacterium durans]|uniref:Uncharacterized protein n=2 Tax=Methylobacterium durans TaxID=2202825 RepID=A0A2U8WCQ2_9HYPH|nr:hypothetical protein DK389_26305 [Methylobacterium durans]
MPRIEGSQEAWAGFTTRIAFVLAAVLIGTDSAFAEEVRSFCTKNSKVPRPFPKKTIANVSHQPIRFAA